MHVFLPVSCPFCTFTSKHEKKLYKHLESKHSIIDVEMCYVTHVLKQSSKPSCACSDDCNETINWAGWKKGYQATYVRGHNARVYTAFANPDVIQAATQKRVQGYAEGKYAVWNAGLTKETDERIASSSQKISKTLNEGYASGRIIDWHVKDPQKAISAQAKMSKTKKQNHASGKTVPWNKGLTASTDPRMRKIGNSISVVYDNREAGRRLSMDELTQRAIELKGVKMLTPLEEYRSKHSQQLEFKCLKCERKYTALLRQAEGFPLCRVCHPRPPTIPQQEVFDYVQSLLPDTTILMDDRNVIRPKEIEVLVPGVLGVEYHVLWHHSERIVGNMHAATKQMMAQEKNITLLQIFADEWSEKQSIVKSMIRHRLGLDEQRLGARECTIEKIGSYDARKKFFNDNHIEGNVPASTTFGLIHQNEIVAALSLRQPVYHKSHPGRLEIARFATKMGCSIAGGLSKLLVEARRYAASKEGKRLVTYVDLRVGTGIGYLKTGFNIHGRTRTPRMWWTDFGRRYNRLTVQADRPRGMSQEEVAEEKKLARIWGCHNLILVD